MVGHLHITSLPLRKRPLHPLIRRLGGILGRSDSFTGEKSLAVAQDRNPDGAVPRVVSAPTEVLRYAIYIATITILKPRGYCRYHQF